MTRTDAESSLSPQTLDLRRALESLHEELESIENYHERAEASSDDALQRIMVHNRDEEMEHARQLMDWLRQAMSALDGPLKKSIFPAYPPTQGLASTQSRTQDGEGLGLGGLK